MTRLEQIRSHIVDNQGAQCPTHEDVGYLLSLVDELAGALRSQRESCSAAGCGVCIKADTALARLEEAMSERVSAAELRASMKSLFDPDELKDEMERAADTIEALEAEVAALKAEKARLGWTPAMGDVTMSVPIVVSPKTTCAVAGCKCMGHS